MAKKENGQLLLDNVDGCHNTICVRHRSTADCLDLMVDLQELNTTQNLNM